MNLREYFAPYREQIPALKRVIHLNSGAIGPLSSPVYTSLLENLRVIYENGAINPEVRERTREQEEEARRAIAGFIHASPEEIVLCRSISEMVNMAGYLIPFETGEEFLISTQENHAVIVASLTVSEREHFKVTKFRGEGSTDEIISSFQNELTPKTRLATFSHVTHTYGTKLPVQELCALARKNKTYSFVDGAQAFGNTPIDVKQLGCDFYAICAQKWLGSMAGVSALYIRKELMNKFHPPFGGAGGYSSFDLANNQVFFLEGPQRYEFGTRPGYLYETITQAIRFAEGMGTEHIYARQKELYLYARREISRNLPDAEIFSPEDESQMTGILTIALPETDHDALIRAAHEERNILIWPRNMDLYERKDAVRISLNWFNLEEEIDELIRFIEDYRKRGDKRNE